MELICPERELLEYFKILLGYWPPSNEAVRRFSTNPLLNPEGWIGENWEESGYDIISYFPSFLPPDCMNCGQGNGDFEVDYQDFSEDWWNVVDTISPAATPSPESFLASQ